MPWAPGHRGPLGHLPLLRRGLLPALLKLGAAGPMVRARLGTTTVYVVSDGDLTHEVLADRAAAFGRERVARGMREAMGDGLFTVEAEIHRERRRIVQPAFGRASLAATAPLMCRVASDVAGQWPVRTAFDVGDEALKLSTALTVRALFRSEASTEWVARLVGSGAMLSKGTRLRGVAPRWYSRVPTPGNLAYRRAVRLLREALEALYAHHAPPACGGDLLSLLNRAACPGEGTAGEGTPREGTADEGTPPDGTPRDGTPGITRATVLDEMATFFLAGVGTTGRAVAWACHELAANHRLEEAVQREADALFLSGRPLPTSVLDALPLTSRVISEVLRLYPVPVLPREALREVTVGGFRLPRGAVVVLNLYAMHRDPAVYPHPSAFDPDRWSPDAPHPVPRTAYLPFGAAAHRCVGAPFTSLAAPVALAAIATRFRLRPADPHRPVRAVGGVTTFPDRLLMTATPRTGANGRAAGLLSPGRG
ncbi:cytochrome P450 [Streptomyces sp. CB03238]|uniref:cytochrome P450 n=1 Tax=Streptomyces sp. CB03238 TaxID=1907777 RepID=UPI00117D96A8|nr:cytochrome P450 [Streptomyces sp. CB03238]